MKKFRTEAVKTVSAFAFVMPAYDLGITPRPESRFLYIPTGGTGETYDVYTWDYDEQSWRIDEVFGCISEARAYARDRHLEIAENLGVRP